MPDIIIRPLEDINFGDEDQSVGLCDSEEDLMLMTGEHDGKVICPATEREINLIGGNCQERACEFHFSFQKR